MSKGVTIGTRTKIDKIEMRVFKSLEKSIGSESTTSEGLILAPSMSEKTN